MMTTTEFYTKVEIDSQPKIWEKTLSRLQGYDESKLPRLNEYDQVIFTGCGSTYYLAIWAARQCQQTNTVLSRAVPAGELLMSPQSWFNPARRTLLVAISRSAYTTETVRALQIFQEGGYGDDLSVTCYPENTLAKLSRRLIAVPDAQEMSVAQTRSFSSMMLALLYLIFRGIPGDAPELIQQAGERLFARFGRIVEEIAANPSIDKFIFLGSGPLYGLANELMLKMKEISQSTSEAYHFLEFRHGPISMLNDRSLVSGLMDGDSTGAYLKVLRDIKNIGAKVLTLSEKPVEDPGGIIDFPVVLQSGLPSPWYAPLFLPVIQRLAFERALVNHQNPDRPVNLTAVVEAI